MRKYKIIFYKTNAGRRLIWKFLRKLSSKDLFLTLELMRLLRDKGATLQPPVMKTIDGKLKELRGKTKDHWIRVFYFMHIDDIIVIIDGIIKKDNKIPLKDVKRMKKYMNDFIRRYAYDEMARGKKTSKNK